MAMGQWNKGNMEKMKKTKREMIKRERESKRGARETE